eukprot:TRINITY_DN929_c3_g5_i1.p1 TRINITY_DN929_c3_g5~~TRINITY_DN929_c3_g5_i1.p1  ORF type:complete len:577 (+),score=219.39 TRINITY_DN929_c3_g5_i1:67-1797(+)
MPAKRASRATAAPLSEAQQNTLGAVGLVVVAAVCFLAYRVGAGRGADEGKERSRDLRLRGEIIREQITKCHHASAGYRKKMEALQGESAEVAARSGRLEAENDRLVQLNSKLEKRSIECVESTELTKQQWNEEDARNAEKLQKLERRNKELRRKSKRLSGVQGMRTILLLSNIKKLAQEMTELRKSLGMPQQTVDSEFIDGMVTKWQKIDEDIRKGGGTGPMSHKLGEVLPPNRSEMWAGFKRPSILERFDPDRHVRTIFIPKKDVTSGDWQLPCWSARCGTQDLRHGTYIDSRSLPITDVNRQMRVLYEYALCAVGLNISKFMYPTSFKRCKSCHTEYVHNYIETPLVLFCDDCRPQHAANEFRLLCQGHTSEDQYGSDLFWRTRSRLRFKGRYVSLAQSWLSFNSFMHFDELGKAKEGHVPTLAVRLPRAGFKDKCGELKQINRPTLAYSRLLKGRVREYSHTFDEQCFPAWLKVVNTINKKVKAITEKGASKVKVYVSTDCTEEEWDSLVRQVNVPIYRRLATGKPTEDDIVDTYISAHADHLIVHRYDIKSTNILEAHMLLHSLLVSGVAVW